MDMYIGIQACRNLASSPEALERKAHWEKFRADIIEAQKRFMALPKAEQKRLVEEAKKGY